MFFKTNWLQLPKNWKCPILLMSMFILRVRHMQVTILADTGFILQGRTPRTHVHARARAHTPHCCNSHHILLEGIIHTLYLE